MAASAFVDTLHVDGTNRPTECTLVLQYEGKEARLTIPVGEPLFDREPGVEVYRREVIEVIAALQEVVDSPQGIRWPARRGN